VPSRAAPASSRMRRSFDKLDNYVISFVVLAVFCGSATCA
jgi:hypothetical protein